MRDRRALLAALAVVLVVVAHFREAVFRGQAFFHRDVHLMWYSQVETLVRGVAKGEWPFWNPYVGFGQPLWADANNQILYPTTWLHLVLRPWTVYTLYVVVHFTAAGLGLFLLARRLGVSALGASAGALALVVSGPMLSTAEIWNQLAGVAWTPWAGLAAVTTLESGRVRSAVAWGACHALQVLAGSPEGALASGTMVAAYAVVMRPVRGDGVSAWRIFSGAGIAVAIALALSAGQWLPAMEVAMRSNRLHLAPEARGYWSAHPLLLLQTVVPVPLHRLELRPDLATALHGAATPLLPSLYLGAGAFPLAALGLAAGGMRARWLLGGGIVAGAVVALGGHTPVHGLLVSLVPPLGALRYPVKVMPFVGLLWAGLIARGVDAWGRERRTRVAAIVAALSVATVIANGAIAMALTLDPRGAASAIGESALGSWERAVASVPPRVALAATAALVVLSLCVLRRRLGSLAPRAATVVVVVDLLLVHEGLSPLAPRELFTIRPAALDLASSGSGRLYAYDYFLPGKSRRHLGRDQPYRITRAPVGWPVPAATALAMRLALFPPSAAPWGIAGSFDRDTPGIAPRELAELLDLFVAVEGTAAHLRLLQAGAVARVAALHTDGLEALEPLGVRDALLSESVHVFAVPRSRPRAYVVGTIRRAIPGEALRLLLNADVDIEREAIITSVPGPRRGVTVSATVFDGKADVVDLGTDRITVDVETSAPAYLVLVEAYDPSWRARVGGEEVPVLRANVAFMAVPLDGGRRRVEFSYEPRGVRWGLTISAVSIAVMTALVVGSRDRKAGAS